MPSRPSVGRPPSCATSGATPIAWRSAITGLLAFDGEHVTFHWKDYAHGDQRRTMTLSAMEFLRRFVQHILPRGFVRIRQSGFLANTCRVARVALARTLLATPAPAAHIHGRDRDGDHRRRRPARRGRVRDAAPR